MWRKISCLSGGGKTKFIATSLLARHRIQLRQTVSNTGIPRGLCYPTCVAGDSTLSCSRFSTKGKTNSNKKKKKNSDPMEGTKQQKTLQSFFGGGSKTDPGGSTTASKREREGNNNVHESGSTPSPEPLNSQGSNASNRNGASSPKKAKEKSGNTREDLGKENSEDVVQGQPRKRLRKRSKAIEESSDMSQESDTSSNDKTTSVAAIDTNDSPNTSSHVLGEYHPVDSVSHFWSVNQPVPYRALTDCFRHIEDTSSRLAIQETLCNLFRSIITLSPFDLLPSIYLCSSKLAPAYEGVELGLGDALLTKAIAQATGREIRDVKALAKTEGDLGLVAEKSRTQQKTLGFAARKKPLEVKHVYDVFREIASASGNKMQERKVEAIKKLLVQAEGEHAESRYIIRCLQGKLRIGMAENTVLTALAHAFTITPPVSVAAEVSKASSSTPSGMAGTWASTFDTRVTSSGKAREKTATQAELEEAVQILRQVFSEVPSFDAVVPALLSGGVHKARERCALTPGVPVTPMLAKPTKGVSEVLDRFENQQFTCEWKYDGERAQIHKFHDKDGQACVKIFSRNSEDTTGKYPDLAEVVPSAEGPVSKESNTTFLKEIERAVCVGDKDDQDVEPPQFGTKLEFDFQVDKYDTVDTYVMDGEVVAYDPQERRLLPFQKLSTRARKDVTTENIKVQVIYAAFDLLYLNGQSLLREPFAKRRAMLHHHFLEVPGKFAFANGADYTGEDVNDVDAYLKASVDGNCEGLMVKTLMKDATYEPAKRSLNWLKLKKDYMDGLTDSFDLVPVGAWYGKGKRTGWFGSYLLATYDDEEEEFQTIARVGTGFSDKKFNELSEMFKGDCIICDSKPKNVRVGNGLTAPHVWFEPKFVWEVKAADLSISPVHTAAVGKAAAGKGIALRFPRFLQVREDKNAEDCTNANQVLQMYYDQPQVSNSTAPEGEDDDDIL
eukprot:gb/GECG01013479.1/.p1 GENE.gb/GECG01013479.1/~~gb/GECG01013479.1/.p1  ORF type:complete len:952 (+),score=140.08 gb/GECG01013479.1/:1-2856(+)